MKKIVVTGGAGFIGSHLVDRLLEEGNGVVVLDNLTTGRRENLEVHKGNSKLQIIEHNVISPIDLKGISQIYHLACPASPIHYQAYPIQTLKTNFLGTLNMLELAQKNSASFLLASTSEIYGDPLEHPQNESYKGNVNTVGPRSCYDEGKRVAEALAYEFKQEGVAVKVVRIFNTYGPRMNFEDGRVVSNFVLQALQNKPITIYGDGRQSRSFCYISDLVDGLQKMMNTKEFFGPVNLGNPQELTVFEIAKEIVKLTGSKSKIEFKDLPVDDPTKRKPDITLAKKKLGFTPKIFLEEGLKNIIDDFKARLA
ncbi:MAG TPA: UDP-glucuronic acid decarboxylase family protein [Candidatus Paceibacterota bacterium]